MFAERGAVLRAGGELIGCSKDNHVGCLTKFGRKRPAQGTNANWHNIAFGLFVAHISTRPGRPNGMTFTCQIIMYVCLDGESARLAHQQQPFHILDAMLSSYIILPRKHRFVRPGKCQCGSEQKRLWSSLAFWAEKVMLLSGFSPEAVRAVWRGRALSLL